MSGRLYTAIMLAMPDGFAPAPVSRRNELIFTNAGDGGKSVLALLEEWS